MKANGQLHRELLGQGLLEEEVVFDLVPGSTHSRLSPQPDTKRVGAEISG